MDYKDELEEICLPYFYRKNPCHCMECLGRAGQRASRFLAIPIEKRCKECRGKGGYHSGRWDSQEYNCITCKGTGKITLTIEECIEEAKG